MHLAKRMVRQKTASGEEIWLNALSGTVDRLSRAEVTQVERFLEGRPVDSTLIGKLKSRGYLFDTAGAEQASFRRLVAAFGASPPAAVTNLVICPTYSCNLSCVYCFERRSHPHPPRERMDITAVNQVFDAFARIRRLRTSRNYVLGLFGGEPLLMSTRFVVSRILARAGNESLPVVIVTNGVNAAGYLPLLEEHKPGIQGLQVTLDGPEEVHNRRRPDAAGRGTFGAVAAAVDILLEKNMRVMLRVNIDLGNVGQLPRLAEVISGRGWAGHPSFSCGLAPVTDRLASGEIPDVPAEADLLSALLDVYDQCHRCEELFGLKGLQALGPLRSLLGEAAGSRPKIFHCEANYGGFWVAGPEGLLYACPEAIGQPDLAIGRYAPVFEAGACDALVRSADHAMRTAKRAGRNRLQVFSKKMPAKAHNPAEHKIFKGGGLSTIRSLAAALDAKDSYTASHSQAVQGLAAHIAREMRVGRSRIEALEIAALLHDIGKVAVPDAILNKPGPLDQTEWAIMREHPRLGVMILREARQLSTVLPIVFHHHERYDGSGYPEGRGGKAIPALARILCVADSFMAMVSTRPYRKAMRPEHAWEEVKTKSGIHFDPDVVAALGRVLPPRPPGGKQTDKGARFSTRPR